MNLYEINAAIMDCIDAETGEIIDEEALTALQMDFDEKTEGIALWIKNLTAEAKAIKKEKDSLNKRQKTCENKAESLKKYLSSALNGQKFATPKVAVSFRKSQSVAITDFTKVPDDYLKYSEPTVNKELAKKSLKEGIKIAGLELTDNVNISIK